MSLKSKEVKKLLPTQEAFQIWQEIIFFASGIKFSKDVIIAGFFMDVGYRGGMNTFSQFMFTDVKEDPWNHAVSVYLDGDEWVDNLDTDLLGSLLNKCCLIQFGMEHPKYGDTDEYKKKFDKAVTLYTSTVDKMGIELIEIPTEASEKKKEEGSKE